MAPVPALRGLGLRLRAIGRDRRGNAVVEFALVGIVLIALLLPMIDIGMGFYYKTQLMTAAQAGAQYAMNNRGAYVAAWSTTDIKNAVISATGLSIQPADITATLACKCVDQGSGTLTASSPGSPADAGQCTGSSAPNCTGMSSPTQKPGAYVTVTVAPASLRNYKPLFNFAGFGTQVALSAGATVRIQ